PFFNGANYAYWKNRMMYFIQASDMGAWNAVEEGYIKPLTHPRLWSEGETRMFQLNSKAIHIIFCALGLDEYGRVSSCTTAKEIWYKLQVTQEGTDEVKKSKISILTHSYENFRMKPNEDIKAMTDRFSTIVNGLKSYGEIISNEKLVRKLVYSLPKSWQSKKTAIIESKDLTSLTLEELIGSLLTHEMMSWYLDSGCSRHMTGDKSRFIELNAKNGGEVTFGDNSKGHIEGIGTIGNTSSIQIKNVLYVNGLKHNLLSISQLCDKGFNVLFEINGCKVIDIASNRIMLVGHRIGNIYMVHLDSFDMTNLCLVAKDEHDSWLWHRRLGHASMSVLQRLIQGDLVRGLPKLKFDNDKICDACAKGKQKRVSFKSINDVSTSRVLQLIHVDLFGPTRTTSLGGKQYAFVLVDDYSRYTWVLFLRTKDEALEQFITFSKIIQNEKGYSITSVRSDHGTEFENLGFIEFCNSNGISHNFSAPRTPQQNGVVERKNRTLEEMARTMLCENNLPKYFWTEATNTACYVVNRVMIRPILKKTPYEIFKNKKPNISYFHPFGCKCFVLNNGKENLGKFDAKSDEGIFLGYSLNSKAYRVFNKRTLVVEESIHVVFDEAIRMLLAFACFHEFKLYQMDVKSAFLNGFIKEEVYVEQPPGFEESKFPDHVLKLTKALYGLKQAPRAWYERLSNFLIEKGFSKGNVDTTLFLKHKGKDLLVAQIYVDDIIFGSTNDVLCQEFSKLMQSEFEMSMMGELSFFLGLQIKQRKDGIFIYQAKYVKDMLMKFGLENGKPHDTPMSSSTKLYLDEGGKCVDVKLYRSMIGSLLYLTASRPDIMFSVCLCARFQSCPKESHLLAVKRIFRYFKDTPSLGLWYPRDSSFNLHAFSDADYGGCKIDRKSTSGTCQFLGNMLISWFSKKQNCVALSTTEAEYISAGSCCAQVLWMKQQLFDYGIEVGTIPIKCDNTSAICLTKNPIQHSRTKHIEIRHHFIRDHVTKEDLVLEFVDTLHQLADIFTKPLDKERFWTLRR
ncbi:uncharacterized protein LOC120116622, partial [Hibiscus syriacus]|uniref:uncharacterized protein LOC120116622 n=1 Tax=Hibiscus syriacus TaxID=106335 RepID=UPI001923BDE6